VHDRRRHVRNSCRIRAEFRAGPGFAWQRPIVDISEDGAFGLVQPALRPGAKATIRFHHPWASRIVQTRAVVARRVMADSPEGAPGLGFYFLQGLSELGAERRGTERATVNTPVRMALDRTLLDGRIIELSGLGATLELDLGLKRLSQEGSVPGVARRVMGITHLLRTGTVVQLAFRDPATFQPIRTRAVIARTPSPVADGRPDYRIGVRFEMDITALLVPPDAPVPPPRKALGVSRAGNLDQAATQELQMRSLLRQVDWSTAEGHYGTGRLVLAGPRKVLVACRSEPPPVGTEATVVLQTPDDSSAPPLGLYVQVARSGGLLVAGAEAGFVGGILGFFCSSDEQRYQALVSWLTGGFGR
jgi:hypothetical protein